MVQIRVTQGQHQCGTGAPVQRVPQQVRRAASAAILGADFPRLRPALEVAAGDPVITGQVVFRDRRHSEVAFVAPLSGRVSAIDYGPRRTLSALVIQSDEPTVETPASTPIDDAIDAVVPRTLLARGMWPAFRTRPFGRIPDPDARPDAIFVTATQGSPMAPDPAVVLARQTLEFQYGVELLTRLTEGIVYSCQAPGEALCPHSPRVNVAYFNGTAAAGLTGTHINRLHRVGAQRQVWSIGYQDVAAIGHLFKTGQYLSERVISIAGPGAAQPQLIRTCLGANIRDITAEERAAGDGHRVVQCLSGDVLTGRDTAFVGRYHQQITILEKPAVKRRSSWLEKLSSAPGALIPTGALEHALAIDVLPVPLMRALSVGDSEAAKRLGCLELVEEDVAVLSQLCTSGADYGTLLRRVLDDLAEDAA